MSQQFIKLVLPLPSFFKIHPSSDTEPNVFRISALNRQVSCVVCSNQTVRHSKERRRFRHSYAWGVGTIWIEIDVPRQVCKKCGITFVHDFGLGIVRSSTRHYRVEIAKRCHGRTISDVSREYGVPYTTVERWFYQYASCQLETKTAKHVLVDEFATRKGHHYATVVIDAKSGCVLSIVEGRDEAAISLALSQVKSTIQTVVSDFAPAMSKATSSVIPDATHVLDRFHLIQFFTDALRRRRRFLDETKRHYHVRTIDRSLACRPEQLDDAGLEVARACLREDEFIKDIYYGLQHMRFVLKSTTSGQASRRLKEWIDRFMFHPCGPLAKIAKAVIVRQREMENTILSPFSNGKIEGTNNKIKLIKRRAFGYRNLNNFFTRLKLELGSSK